MELIKELWSDGWPGRILLVAVPTVLGLILLSLWAAKEEQSQWARFAAAHECKIVGQMSGSTSTGIGYGLTSSGQFGTVITTNTTPAKTGYLCNDGVTYWR